MRSIPQSHPGHRCSSMASKLSTIGGNLEPNLCWTLRAKPQTTLKPSDWFSWRFVTLSPVRWRLFCTHNSRDAQTPPKTQTPPCRRWRQTSVVQTKTLRNPDLCSHRPPTHHHMFPSLHPTTSSLKTPRLEGLCSYLMFNAL